MIMALRPISEILSHFEDENGHIDQSQLQDVLAALTMEFEQNAAVVAANRLTPAQTLDIHVDHFATTFDMIVRNMATLYAEVIAMTNLMVGEEGEKRDPEEEAAAFHHETMQAISLDRLSRIYDAVYQKARPKLEVPK